MKKVVLVTGAAGMLGSALIPALEKCDYEVHGTDINDFSATVYGLDVTYPTAVFKCMKLFQPDFVIHLAAMTNLEHCEAFKDQAEEVNVHGTYNVARAAASVRAKFIYISTAGVFDGQLNGSYNEATEPNPINQYGITKLRGEYATSMHSLDNLIIRIGWLFGGGPKKDHKFVSLILNQWLKEPEKTIQVVNDKWGSPTSAYDLSNAIIYFMRNGMKGIWHSAGEGSATRAEVAKYLDYILVNHFNKNLNIEEVSSDYFKETFPVNRPKVEVLDNLKQRMSGNTLMRHWKEALRDYILTEWSDAINSGNSGLPRT